MTRHMLPVDRYCLRLGWAKIDFRTTFVWTHNVSVESLERQKDMMDSVPCQGNTIVKTC